MSNLEINPNKFYILAGDISASMLTKDDKCGGLTRYNYMLEKFQAFIKNAEDFDSNKPTVLLFGQNVHIFPNVTLDDVKSKLEKVKDFEGFTNTDLLIDESYTIHKRIKKELASQGKMHPGTLLFIFTDGQPTNRKAVAAQITKIANEIDREDEFSISFLTVGTIDRDLEDYLEHLHEGLNIKSGFDIVHVYDLKDTTFLGATAGAVHD